MKITYKGEQIELATAEDIAALRALIDANALSVKANADQIVAALNKIGSAPAPPTPTPQREGIEVGPEDDLQEAIQDASGRKIWLKDGGYKPFRPASGTEIEAINHGKARVMGSVPWSAGWEKRGSAWLKPFSVPFWQHPASKVHGDPARGIPHRRSMQPHLLMFGNYKMQPVYLSRVDLLPGEFYLEGTAASPVGIWARFPQDVDPSHHDIRMAVHQSAISADRNTDGVKITGLHCAEFASTKLRGVIDLPEDSDDWEIKDTTCVDSAGEGVVMRGKGHLFERVVSNYHGISGFAAYGLLNSRLIDCEGSHNAWKPGLDIRWHGGNKIANSSYNEIIRFVSIGNHGAGLWLDISNMDNVIRDLLIDGAVGAGLFLEHHSLGSEPGKAIVSGGTIRGTRRIPGVSHFGSGLLMQRAVRNWLIENLTLEDNEDGSVYYKKREEHGDTSGGNTFRNITYDGRWAIQGPLGDMPDRYEEMTLPNFANWP